MKTNKEVLQKIQKENRETAIRMEANLNEMGTKIADTIGNKLANSMDQITRLMTKLVKDKSPFPATGNTNAHKHPKQGSKMETEVEEDMFETDDTNEQQKQTLTWQHSGHPAGGNVSTCQPSKVQEINYYTQSNSLSNAQRTPPKQTQSQEPEKNDKPTIQPTSHEELLFRLTQQEEKYKQLEDQIKSLEGMQHLSGQSYKDNNSQKPTPQQLP